MEDLFGKLFFRDAQKRIEQDRAKVHSFSTMQAILIAGFLASIVTGLLYLFTTKNGLGPRQSSLVAIFIIVMIASLAFLDCPDRELFKTVLIIGLVLLSFEIVGYEALRYLKGENLNRFLNQEL